MGLWETRRPFVSSVEVVSAWRLQRSVGVRLLFYLSMQDLATGRRLQATQPSQVHCCLFALQQQLVLRRVRHRISISTKERAAFYAEVSVKNNLAQKKEKCPFFHDGSAQTKTLISELFDGHWQSTAAKLL